MSVGELAAYICSHLKKHNIDVVLSGGGCVTIYSKNRYVSSDLDFIDSYTVTRKRVREVLAEIGFHENNRYFCHPEAEYLVEFPSGPLSIGAEPVKHVDTLQFLTGDLRLLSPTDCVKDRLAHYYHWNDLQCLEQAVLVTLSNDIDMNEVKRWSEKEGKTGEFLIFKKQVIQSRSKKE
jgi:hypothetical protein